MFQTHLNHRLWLKKKNFKKYIYCINIPGTLTFPTFREVASKTTNYVFQVLWHHVLLLLIWLSVLGKSKFYSKIR